MNATLPVIETFGPTIQGEGPDAGMPCSFVRFGLCDYDCSWCDTPYAVDPAQVKANAERLTADEIMERVPRTPRLVVLSGGNPAIHQLGPLVSQLQKRGHLVSVETQGSLWRPWLTTVDRLVVSPKPPSSGMATSKHARQTASFIRQCRGAYPLRVALKIVVFDHEDYEWAAGFADSYMPLYLSAGTPQGRSDAQTKEDILARYRWLCDRTAADPRMAAACVLPQLHVLAFGTMRGV